MIGSTELSISNLDSIDNEGLLVELEKSKKELFNLRFQMATGQLDAYGRIRAVKKDIARIQTVLRERQLDIRTEPEGIHGQTKKDNSDSKASTSSKTSKSADQSIQLEDDVAVKRSEAIGGEKRKGLASLLKKEKKVKSDSKALKNKAGSVRYNRTQNK